MFLGEVTGVEMLLDRGQPELTVIADDLAYKMTLGTKVRTFTKVSYSEVISQIAQEYGLQGEVTASTGTAGISDAGRQRLRLPHRNRRPHRQRLVGGR